MLHRQADRLAVRCPPDTRLFVANRQEGLPVRAEGCRTQLPGVRQRWLKGRAGGRVPEASLSRLTVVVAAAGEDHLPVGTEGDGPDWGTVAQRRAFGLSGGDVPPLGRGVLAAG